MPGYSRAIAAASSSTTPSPHSADAIFWLMYLPSSQYSSTSSVLIAWYARRRAASISARTSSNLRTAVSVTVRRDGARPGVFAAFARVLRDCVTASNTFANEGNEIVGGVERGTCVEFGDAARKPVQ